MAPTCRAIRVWLAIAAAIAMGAPAHAATLEIPIVLDYRIVEEALAQQVFTGPDRTAEVLSDTIGCNTLLLSNLRLAGGEDERMHLVTDLRANVGTPIGGKCWFARTWHGVIETEQTAHVAPDAPQVRFQVVESRLLRAEDDAQALPRFMQKLINDYVHPRLGAVTIDLAAAVGGIDELIALTVPERDAPVELSGVHLSPESLVVTLALGVPDAPPDWDPASEPPLTEAELAAWDANWQAWDAFATWTIKLLGASADPELRRALAESLLEARYELRDALARDERNRDPVRDLFLQTWTRLAPLLDGSNLPIPGGQALGMASFISAGNALQALDEVAPHLGFRIDRDALRAMARMLVPTVNDQALQYDTTVDPELRALMGLGPELEPQPQPDPEPQPEQEPPQSEPAAPLLGRLLGWLVQSAYASQIDPGLVQRLNTWIPRRSDIDNYLETMDRLLDAVVASERANDKVPRRFLSMYDPLLRATAWQESCWRQYIERQGEIEPIRSSAGSVGLMQINMHVWRGVYDVDEIQGNVGYNARAGNEILAHYLVDYAIRKNEHELTGDDENLVRATYAMYNGGPGHIRRYREEKTPASLKRIDKAFWAKYQAISELGAPAVKPCIVGG